MTIKNWLAKIDGNEGLAFTEEFGCKKIRIYGNVYGHPNFSEGEYVQTTLVTGYDGKKVMTKNGEEYILGEKDQMYSQFLTASTRGLLVIKNWSVGGGKLFGTTLNGEKVAGKLVGQNVLRNICTFEDGTKVFVDWMSKAPTQEIDMQSECFLFGLEKCMPDIFGKHFGMFKK